MELKEFIEELLAKKNARITDEVFLLIEKDRDLMKKYLKLVEEKKLQTVNSQIARAVVKKYGLESDTVRNYEPESVLVTSYKELV
jgi:nitrogenase subunit NifH